MFLEAGSAVNSSCLSWSVCRSKGNADKGLDLAKFLCLLVIIESLELDGISKGHLPCHEQGQPLLGQVTQSPIQPGLECFQGLGIQRHYKDNTIIKQFTSKLKHLAANLLAVPMK